MNSSTYKIEKTLKNAKKVDLVSFGPKYLGSQIIPRHAAVNSKYSRVSGEITVDIGNSISVIYWRVWVFRVCSLI